MGRKFFTPLFAVFVPALLVAAYFSGAYSYIAIGLRNAAATFFIDSIKSEDILAKYNSADPSQKVKILIVPGHDNQTVGAVYNGLRETDMNLALAKNLVAYLKGDSRLDVVLARDDSGYNPLIENYYQTNKLEIIKFVASQKAEMKNLIDAGEISVNAGAPHANAPSDAAYRLYAINKWASENGEDLVLHIHFNNYPHSGAGQYQGFVVYVPDPQYSNAKASLAIATPIFSELSRFFPKSSFVKESAGIVPDQQLIAVGAKNTADSAALLIEYGYIYEPQFAHKNIRALLFQELPARTYVGLEKFFGKSGNIIGRFNSFLLPHNFTAGLAAGDEHDEDALALQAALAVDGEYPPAGRDKYDCPITGSFKNCTASALSQFQKKYGISGEDNFVGQKTAGKLNELFGS